MRLLDTEYTKAQTFYTLTHQLLTGQLWSLKYFFFIFHQIGVGVGR